MSGFEKILIILVIIFIFCPVGLHFTLTSVSGFILQIKPATNLNLIAFRLQQMLYYVNFI